MRRRGGVGQATRARFRRPAVHPSAPLLPTRGPRLSPVRPCRDRTDEAREWWCVVAPGPAACCWQIPFFAQSQALGVIPGVPVATPEHRSDQPAANPMGRTRTSQSDGLRPGTIGRRPSPRGPLVAASGSAGPPPSLGAGLRPPPWRPELRLSDPDRNNRKAPPASATSCVVTLADPVRPTLPPTRSPLPPERAQRPPTPPRPTRPRLQSTPGRTPPPTTAPPRRPRAAGCPGPSCSPPPPPAWTREPRTAAPRGASPGATRTSRACTRQTRERQPGSPGKTRSGPQGTPACQRGPRSSPWEPAPTVGAPA